MIKNKNQIIIIVQEKKTVHDLFLIGTTTWMEESAISW